MRVLQCNINIYVQCIMYSYHSVNTSMLAAIQIIDMYCVLCTR